MDRLKILVIKQEFDDDLSTPLEGWSVVTGDTVTNSSGPLSSICTTTQSVSNQFPSIASTSNDSSTSTSSQLQQTTLHLDLELQLKQTREQLKEVTEKLVNKSNAYSILEKKYDQLKLDYFELKSNANMKLVQLDTLQMDNDKLKDELNHLKCHQVTLMAQINAQTPTEINQANAHIYTKEQIVHDDSTRPQLLCNLIQVGQNADSGQCLSLSNGTELSDDDSLSNQAIDILSHHNQLNFNPNSVSQCTARVNEHVSPSVNGQIDVLNKLTDQSGGEVDVNEDDEDTEVDEESGQKEDEGDDEHEMDAIEHGQASKRFKRTVIQQEESDANNAIGEESIATECTTSLIQPNRHLQCSHCTKSFDRHFNLQRHLRVHTGERPFQCDQCEKQFTQKVNLETHQRTHFGERPYQCNLCDKSFAELATLNTHEQAIHLHVKPYRCKQCGLTCTVRANIIRHIRFVHFGLPRTIKEQQTLNIVDDREPRELIEKV